MNQGYNTYKAANVETADKGKLIIICYDVAIKHANFAMDTDPNDYKVVEKRTKHLYKVQDALTELLVALDLSTGEIAKNLYRLYEYMIHRMTEAVTKRDNSPVEEVLGYLNELRDAWKVAIVKVKESGTAPVSNRAIAING